MSLDSIDKEVKFEIDSLLKKTRDASLQIAKLDTNIKNKIINKIDRLPSLSSMEKIIFLLICIAFPIMTIGFGLGFILSKEQIGTYWFGSVSAISIISWTIFFLIIQVKAFFSLSGLKISYYSLVGFISIILGYIAMYSLKLPSHTFISMGS